DVAERLLRQVEHGQERRPPVRIEPLEPVDFCQLLDRERDGCRGARGCVRPILSPHRSSSPPIMFTEPNVGMRSATIPPSIIRWRAAIGGRHGGRQRTRYGRSLPSDTTYKPSSPFAPSTATYASPCGGRMPKPSMISMKWFISPSIDPYVVSLGGRTTRLSGALTRAWAGRSEPWRLGERVIGTSSNPSVFPCLPRSTYDAGSIGRPSKSTLMGPPGISAR